MAKRKRKQVRNRRIDLAAQLRTAVERSGLSRFELAQRTGLSYAVIHRFITGNRDIVLATASKIAAVLDLELRPARKKV